MTKYEITQENYEELVTKSEKPVLLDFWATWCGPCRMVSPVLDEIAEENENLVLGKINVDEQVALAAKFRIVSIPTMILMDHGEQVEKVIGYRPKEELKELLGI